MSLFSTDEAAACRARVKYAKNRDPTTKFMLQKLEEAGCKPPADFIKVEECTAAVGGGFRPDDGVVVCSNHLPSQEEVNHALVHELVHAYDHCRAADLDWSNCEHHACSEVRAANLSGDCHLRQEWSRGNFGVKGQHKVCVRRRAELSVSMNPYCQGKAARAAVDKVFDACFQDTAPFDRIP